MPFLGAATKYKWFEGPFEGDLLAFCRLCRVFPLKNCFSFSESGQHFIFRCTSQKFGSTVKSNRLQCQVSTYVYA